MYIYIYIYICICICIYRYIYIYIYILYRFACVPPVQHAPPCMQSSAPACSVAVEVGKNRCIQHLYAADVLCAWKQQKGTANVDNRRETTVLQCKNQHAQAKSQQAHHQYDAAIPDPCRTRSAAAKPNRLSY